MTSAAIDVMMQLGALSTSIILAYGDSDEYSFIIDKRTQVFQRRSACVFLQILKFLWPYYNNLFLITYSIENFISY